MPKYIDYHPKLPPLPPEAVQQMVQKVKAGKADQYGVKALNAYLNPKEGKAWCLTEAPNADAVCKSHEALGFKLEKNEVSEVQSLV